MAAPCPLVPPVTKAPPLPSLSAYPTSKGALRGLSRAGALEFAADGIRVNSSHPGIIDTPLAYDPDTGELYVGMNGAPIPRLATVEEFSVYVLFLASEEAAFSTGTELIADGGYLLMVGTAS